MAKVKVEQGKLSQFRPATENANGHTPRGLGALNNAMGKSGYVAPMTAAADGEMVDGSARLEQAFEVFGDEAVIIRHDGKTPIVMVREDLPDAKSPEAKRIAYEANRIAEIDLSWGPLQIAADLEAGLDLDGLFDGFELSKILEQAGELLAREPAEAANDPNAEWRGMPGFEQEDIGAWKTIMVHFVSEADMVKFSKIIHQTITDKTKSVWFPFRPEIVKGVYEPES